MLKTHELKTVTLANPDDLKKIILKHQPIKISGLIKDWNAMRWSIEYFNILLGNSRVKVLTNLPSESGGILKGGQEKYGVCPEFCVNL